MNYALLLALPMFAGVADSRGAVIINTTTTAIFERTSGTGGTRPLASTPTAESGVSFNVTFTPNSVDIGENTTAIPLLEIGSTGNGAGLYLLGGQVYFLAKTGTGIGGNFVTTYPDTTGDTVGVRSSDITGFGGSLVADTEYSVAGIIDVANDTITLAVQADGGAVFSETWSGVTGILNWYGNESVGAFKIDSGGGGANTVGGNAFNSVAMESQTLAGTKGQTVIYNEVATVIPEPSVIWLGALGGLLLLRRRR